MTQTCQNASLYPWATAGNTGKVINMEFKPAWLELTTKDNGTYDSQTVASGNANKNGPLSGAYNVLDKAEHVVTVSKSDTETGISLTIAVDGQAYVENFALEETALQGDYYFSTGMQAWGDVTLSEEEDNYEDRTIIDHSSGEISTEECAVFLEAVKKELETDIFHFYVGTSYRHCLIWENGEVVDLVQPHDVLGPVSYTHLTLPTT